MQRCQTVCTQALFSISFEFPALFFWRTVIALFKKLHGMFVIGAAVIFQDLTDAAVSFLQIPDNFVQANFIQILYDRKTQLLLKKPG